MATEVLQLGIDSTPAAQGARVFERATASVQQGATKADAATKKLDTSFDKLRSRVNLAVRALGAIGITLGAGAFVRSVARATADMDTLRLSLNAVTGSSIETARQLKELREVAKLPGLGFKEAVQGAVNLQVVGFNAKETTRILKDFGNAVALTGGGKNELDRIIFQFTQMSSLGKVTSQDLKPIIQTAPAVAKAMLAVFGTISPEKIEAMGLTFDQFVAKLLVGLEQLPTATGGVKNAFENLSDASFQAGAAFGKFFVSAIGPAVQGLANFLQSLADNRKELASLALGVSSLAKALAIGGLATAFFMAATALGGLLEGLVTAVKGLTTIRAAIVGLNASLGPAGWLILGVGALATYFYNSGKAAKDAAADLDKFSDSLVNLNKQQLLVEQFKLNDMAARIQGRMAGISPTRSRTMVGTDPLAPGATVTEANPEFTRLGTQLDTVIRQSVLVAETLKGIVTPAGGGGNGKPPLTPEELARQVAEKLEKAITKVSLKLSFLMPRLADNADIIAARGGLGRAGLLGLPAGAVPVPTGAPGAPKDTLGLRFKAAGGYLSQGFDAVKAGDFGGAGKAILSAAGALGPLALAALALKPIFEGLMKVLGPVLDTLARPLEIVGELLGSVIAPVLKLLEPPLKMLAKAASYAVEGLGYLIYALAKAVDAIIPFSDPLKAVEKYGKDLIAGAQAARKSLDDMGKAADSLAATLSTDLPHAINLALYRSRIGAPGGGTGGGTGGGGSPYTPPGGTMPGHRPAAPAETTQQFYFAPGSVVNNAGDSEEDLARKMARGAQILASQGVSLRMPGLVTV